MSYDDFCRLEFDEFSAVYKAYMEQRDADYKDGWNRMRMLATVIVSSNPYLKKDVRITPEKLLPFPWDRKPAWQGHKDAPALTKEEQRRRMKELVEKLGDKTV